MRKKLFALLIAAIAAALLLTACAGVDITLTFEVDGETYATVSTMGQEAVRMPKDPVKEGYVFDGWYWDKDIWEQPFTANSLLDTPLSENMTVYAKWKGKAEEHVHTFGEWTVVTPATCTTEGTEKRVCSECEKEETRTIEKLPHTCQWETDGTTLRGKCEICGEAVIKEDTLTYELNAEETEYCVSGVREGTAPTDVIIPVKNNGKPITSIGYGAFCDSRLVSVVIPNSVTSIGIQAFLLCGSLVSVNIPDSVTSIGFQAFCLCGSLETLTVAEENAKYFSVENCLIETETKTLIAGCKNSIIPTDGSVTSIGDYAFSGCSFVSVVIPASVTSIGDFAFGGCGSLETLTVAEGNANYYSVENCLIETETKTLIAGCKNSIIPTDGSVTSIGYGAFGGSSLVSVVIPNSVTSIGDFAFGGCDSLVSVAIPNSVTSIGNEAFEACGNLKSVVIPASVTSIGYRAFDGCSSLVSVVIPNGVTSIGDYAFSYCGSLESINIPASVTSIGENAFHHCGSLKSVEIPASVTSIGSWAFCECGSLETLTVAEGNSKYFSAGNCVIETETKTLIIGCKTSVIPTDGSVTSIGRYAFYRCNSLVSIVIPNSVTSIGHSAFDGCGSLETLTVAEGNPKYCSAGNCVIETETKTLILGCKNSVIPTDGSVTSIGSSAFSGCSSLVSVVIPAGVTSIGDQAFKDTGIWNNAADNSVVYADKWAVGYKGNKNSVTEITLRADTVGIGDKAFWGCGSLVSIEIPNSVTSIGNSAFDGCDSLRSVVIPNSVTSIGKSAFSYCSSLVSVVIPNGVTSIGFQAFFDCGSLKSIEIPNSVTSIGSNAFSDCGSLTNVEYKGTKAEWKAIEKEHSWNWQTDDYTVTCTDGTLTKAESQAENFLLDGRYTGIKLDTVRNLK